MDATPSHDHPQGSMARAEIGRLQPTVNISASIFPLQHDNDPDIRRAPDLPVDESIDAALPFTVETNHNEHGKYSALGKAPRMWRPFWLKKRVLAGFLILYTALFTSILLIQYFSVKYNGFFVAQSTSHYTWTYGPTAVLVLVVSLWRQIDYHCKTLTPWSRMYKGPAIASQTILLDYVSPLQIVTFVKATRLRHLPVIATVAGYGLLKLITVFSTGLFVLSTTAFSVGDYPMIANTMFDGSRFNLTEMQQSLISTEPVYAYYGNLKQGLPLATGVAHNLSYTTFEPVSEMPANATLTAEVDAMIPEYSCTVLKSKFDFVSEFGDTFYTDMRVGLPNGVICQQWSEVLIPFSDPRVYAVQPRQLSSDWEPFVSCNDTNNKDSDSSSDIALFWFTDILYQQTPASSESVDSAQFTNVSWEVTKLVTVACLPSYRIVKLNVSNDTTTSLGPTLSASNSTAGRSLPGFSVDDMSQIYNELALATTALPLSTLMTLSQRSMDIEIFSDGEILKTAAQVTFQGVMSQWIQMNLKGQADKPITGSVAYTMNRLHVESMSLWAMVAGFALLMLATIVLLLTTTETVISRDPNTTGAIASILARSRGLNELLSEGNADCGAMLKKHLSGHYFNTVINSQERQPVLKIETSSHLSESKSPARKRKFQTLSWWPLALRVFKIQRSTRSLDCNVEARKMTSKSLTWRPFTLSLPVIMLTFAIPVAIIVVLEVLQSLSDQNNGILNIAHSSAKYVRYLPALIMLLVAMLFSSLDFNVSTFASYSTLYTGSVSSKSTILSNFVGKLPPESLLEAARTRQFGVFASTTAALIGSILTIIVSGLYTVQNVDSQGSTRTLDRVDTFNLTWINSTANDNSAATVLSLIEHLNLTYPKLTYSEIALPAFSLDAWTNSLGPGSILTGPSTASMPALRGNLRCTIIPKSNITVWTDSSAQIDQLNVASAFVNVSFGLPNDCRLGGVDGHSSISSYTNQFGLPNHGGVYAGAQIDLNYGAGAASVTYPGPVHPDDATADNPPGCPSLAFTFGYFEMNLRDKINVTTMACFQEMQEVQTKITLLLNSTQIDPTRPPVVDESSVKTLQNGDSGSTAFQYRIQNNLANDLSTFPGSGFEAVGSADLTLDVFFQAVVGGTEKIAPELLVGPENEQRLFDAINHFYRKYMAQAVNANMRNGCAGPVGVCSGVGRSGTTKRGDIVDSKEGLSNLMVGVVTPRLLQNAAPKLALQIMLGVMTGGGLFAFWFTRMRNLLPYNPCSIAGTMGLLAGSDLCRSHARANEAKGSVRSSIGVISEECQQDLIPVGAEWMSDQELSEVFSRHRYSLGWWQRAHGGQRRYGIDIGMSTALDGAVLEPRQKRNEQKRWRSLVSGAKKGYHKPLQGV